ncbi:MAG: right-handed parallel beta-helix repeat-containing protein [Chloroflexota bacterium]
MTIDGKQDLRLRGVTKWTARMVPTMTAAVGTAAVVIHDSRDIDVKWLAVHVPSSGRGGICDYLTRGVLARGSTRVTVDQNLFAGVGTDTRDCGLVVGVFLDSVKGALLTSNVVQDFVGHGLWMEYSTGTISHNQVRYLHPRDPAGDPTDTVGILAEHGIAAITSNWVRGSATDAHADRWIDTGVRVQDGTFLVAKNAVHHTGVGISAVEVRPASGGSASRVSFNTITSGSRDGIRLESSSGARLAGNRVTGFSGSGLVAADSHGSTVVGNQVLHGGEVHGLDCRDDSTGAGTAGTDNTWTSNVGVDSDPTGLCSPASS